METGMIANLIIEGSLATLALLVGYLYYRYADLLKGGISRVLATDHPPLFDEAPIALLQIGIDSHIQLTNAALRRLLDVGSKHLSSRRFTDIIYPEDIAPIEVAIRELVTHHG